jgi:hypothetical protein
MQNNISSIGIQKERRNEGSLFKGMMTEKFPNLARERNIWIHEVEGSQTG